ncbi:isochorismatase family protein [Humitalea rosea]|uniref:Isochorismatase family protein n=1 Tax=Humitalea rosea TaxID=990373 RepID=A0A2W7INP4_9PROT|nr:isochorismatase family protein [Humitalea rosea]PZW48709.1 isochorismatase family protein [Humitalea rosea]
MRDIPAAETALLLCDLQNDVLHPEGAYARGGHFAPGAWGQALVDALQPAHFMVEKMACSAFHMSRLEWVLRKWVLQKAGIRRGIAAGIVTNGGAAPTVGEAHVREFTPSVLPDGCAAFSAELHETAIAGLRPVARVLTMAEAMAGLGQGGAA